MFWKSVINASRSDGGVRSLLWVAGTRIALAAVLSTALLAALYLAEDVLNSENFARLYVDVETRRLSQRLSAANGNAAFLSAREPAHYFSGDDAYAFRILDKSNTVIASRNAHLFDAARIVGVRPEGTRAAWHGQFSEASFYVAGGRRHIINGDPYWIEVATRGDPRNERYVALLLDLTHDVLLPIIPTVLLSAGLALWSLRRALRPLEAAAMKTRQINANLSSLQIPGADLPREVLELAEAVNDLLARTKGLMTLQYELLGKAAHELRTPLAIMMLEAHKAGHPYAEQLEKDIESLKLATDRLFAFARIQNADELDWAQVDLLKLAHEVVAEFLQLAESRNSIIDVVDNKPMPIEGDFVFLRETVRNLVSNAIIHHPDGARVTVTCGPGATLTVEDDGVGIDDELAGDLFVPFKRGKTAASGIGLGLAIVKRAADLHGARIEVGTSGLGGARIKLDFALGEVAPSDQPDALGPAAKVT